MTRLFTLSLAALLSSQVLLGQAHDRVWLTGYNEFPGVAGYGHAQILFQGDSVLVEPTYLAFNFESTVAVMSDANGNVLFYTNGCEVANRNHQLMPNGAGLNPGDINDLVCPWKGYILPQGAMVLPDPGDTNRYFLLHMGASYDPVRKIKLGPLYYSVVGMTLQNGLGDVISKNNVMFDGDMGSFNAVRHGNGRDWWIIVPAFSNKSWHAFILSPEGIVQHTSSNMALELPNCEKHMGTNISPNGDKVANWGDCKVTILDFDRCLGLFDNLLELPAPTHWIPGGGVAFSPTGRYLYATSQNVLFRADLEAASPKLDTMRYSYDPFNQSPYYVPGNTFHYLVNGAKGAIYGNIPSRARHLHALNEPDGLTIDSINFHAKAINLPVPGVRTLPHLPNYRLYDLPGSPCDTLGINGPTTSAPAPPAPDPLHLQPNPATDEVLVSLHQPMEGRWQLVAPSGQVVRAGLWPAAQTTQRIDVSHLGAGVYFFRFVAESGRVVSTRKVVVAR
ncbi:MAG: T9SS type A sorting domain-containing protein [Saprospiraceae bacterium]|nr:T9SS type A sorting domain-containing protein [Saprospiraceae bacterium]